MALYLGNQKIGGLNVFNDYPNIDITTETPTTINGILKGNGLTVKAATAGVDYQAPITPGDGLALSNNNILSLDLDNYDGGTF